MELPDIGDLCSFEECKQLDYLPVQCYKCKLLFCKEHYADYQHNCTEMNTAKEIQNTQSDDTPKSYPCSISNCKGRELTPIFCEKCKDQFCLKHRLPTDHNCSSLPVKEHKEKLTGQEKISKIIGKEMSKEKPAGKIGKKSSRTSAKVIEMKLKMKSKGENNIPVDERIYFNVYIDVKTSNESLIPLFFSKEFSIGKIIDLIAKYGELKNENHLLDSIKLRLFDVNNVQLSLDAKLKDVLEDSGNNVSSFGELYIKYV